MRTSVATACCALTQWMVPFTLRSAPGMPWRVSGSSVPAQFDEVAVGVLDQLLALDDADAAQAHLALRLQAVEALRRHFGEILALDPQLARERHLARAEAFVLRVVGEGRGFPRGPRAGWSAPASADRAPPCGARAVASRSSRMQPSRTRVVDHAVLLAHAHALDQQAQPGRREAAPAQAAQRMHARVVPAIHEAARSTSCASLRLLVMQ